MPLPFGWRAQQTTDTTGTSTLALNAAETSRRSFFSAVGASSTVVQYLISQSGSSSWEIGLGTFNGMDPGTLTRTSIIASSNAGAAVSWGAGRKDVVLLTLPGQRVRTAFSSGTTAVLADLGGVLDFTGSSSATLALPGAATVPVNAGYLIRNSGTAGAVLTLDANGSETIDGSTTQIIGTGEAAEIWSDGTNWRSGGLAAETIIRTQTVSGSPSNIEFVLPVTGALYRLRWFNVTIASDAQMLLRVSSDGGSNFDAGASDYGRSYNFQSGAASSNVGSTNGSAIILTDTGDGANAFTGEAVFYSGNGTFAFRTLQGQSAFADAAGTLLQGGSFQGSRAATTAMNAIRILNSAGAFGNGGIVSLSYLRR